MDKQIIFKDRWSMINYIWFFMIAASIIYSALNGNLGDLSNAVISGAQEAVELSIFTLGSMCVWLGFLNLAEESGLTRLLSKLLSPIINRLFPEYKDNDEIKGKICMNISANFLGLGNAATPLGLSAMKAMDAKSKGERPTAGMILFVVINTASIQLLPINMAAIRSKYGSMQPFGIITQIWITSVTALLFCVIVCKLMEKSGNNINRLKTKR